MAEDSQGTTVPVQVTQDAPMPSADQQVPGQNQVDNAVVPEMEAPAQPTTEPSLPEGVSERTTREFERLREELRAERQRRLNTNATFNSFAPRQIPVPEPTPLYDPTTGLLNERVFSETQRAAQEARVRAERAEQQLGEMQRQQLMSEDERQFIEAKSTYPELDFENPKVFNKDLHVDVRRILQDSLLNPLDYGLKGNKSLTYKQAADIAKGRSTKVLDKVREEAGAKAVEQLTPKEQASLEATGTPSRRNDTSDEEQAGLSYATRRGDDAAIIARMRKIPVAGKG